MRAGLLTAAARAIGRVRDRARAGWNGLRETLEERRRRRPWLDHLIRALHRYREQRGDRLAAAITFYAFLSFFPLVTLAYSMLGYAVGVSDEARAYLVRAIGDLLPGISAELQVERVAQARVRAGAIGLAGLLVTGLGVMNALREALRDIWLGDPAGGGNFLLKRLQDAGTLVFLGGTLIVSVAVSTVTTRITHLVLAWAGLDQVPGAGAALRLLSVGVAIGFNTLIFLVLFSSLSGTRATWRSIARGALFGAVGFEALKLIGTALVAHTAGNPVYASFAVVAGLLVWIHVVSRFVLFAAAWTATRRAVLRADAEEERAEDEGEPARTGPSRDAEAGREPTPADAR
ncbi:YihY/virulence factor BrkB family protein [Thermomonospora catenispora]|uniref:YihY/virulence factor BrkB family protein n=1 Tax=Thermomonospora catenispora TaxID=2493090 RepID=UPI001F4FF5BA|nr:YihY/virulence factor BrkB family protein [Thermomonospora catenispora]